MTIRSAALQEFLDSLKENFAAAKSDPTVSVHRAVRRFGRRGAALALQLPARRVDRGTRDLLRKPFDQPRLRNLFAQRLRQRPPTAPDRLERLVQALPR